MANRLMANRQYTFERDVKTVFAHVTIGATGAPTLDGPNSLGVLSITRNGVGDYTVVFGTQVNGVNALDTYVQFLDAQCVIKNAAGIPLVEGFGVKAVNVSDPAQASIRVQFFHAAVTTNVNTAAEVTSGDELFLSFVFSDSTAA